MQNSKGFRTTISFQVGVKLTPGAFQCIIDSMVAAGETGGMDILIAGRTKQEHDRSFELSQIIVDKDGILTGPSKTDAITMM